MAEKSAKKKKGKGEANVLASLPSTRPTKLGRRGRDAAAATAAKAKPKLARKKTAKAASKRKPKAKAAAAAARLAAPKVKPVAETATPRPKPVRSASKNLAKPAANSADKRAPASDKPPSGTELVTTVVQAAGELASVGLSIGGQIIKRAVDRLPKP